MIIIEFNRFKEAFRRVKLLSDSNKSSVKALLLEKVEDRVKLKYSDGKKSILDILEIQDGNGEGFERAIVIPLVHLEKFIGLMEVTNANMKVENVTITVREEEKTLNLYAEKLIRLAEEEGDEFRVASTIERQIPYEMPESSLKYGILTRFDYDGMISKADSDKTDIYPKQDLIEMLTVLSDEKSTAVMSSTKTNIDGSTGAGYVVGALHSTLMKNEYCENAGFTFNKMNVMFLNLLGSMPTEKITVYREDVNFVIFTDEERTVCAQYQLPKAEKAEMMTMELMTSINFEINLAFFRVVLYDIITSLKNQSPDENVIITFKQEEDDMYKMMVETSGSKISAKDSIDITIENIALLSEQVKDQLQELTIRLPLKSIHSSLAKLKKDYVILSYYRDEAKKLNIIRVADVLGLTDEKEVQGGFDVGTACFVTTSK